MVIAILAVIGLTAAAQQIRDGRARIEYRTALAREQLQGAVARGEFQTVIDLELPPRLRSDPVVRGIRELARDSVDALYERRRRIRADSLAAVAATLEGADVDVREALGVYEELVRLRPGGFEYRQERDRLRRIVRREELEGTIRIRALHVTPAPGGVNLSILWRNRSPKTVEKARFWVRPVGPSGDVITEDARGSTLRAVEQATPVATGQSCCRRHFFRHLWTGVRVEAAELEAMELVFADGSTERIEESDLALVGW